MITIKNLSKSYGNKELLNKATINIEDNGISFIMGSNGKGKTSFLKCLLNLELYEGEILYDKKIFNDISHDIFAIYDDNPLYFNLTGIQNIKIFINEEINIDKLLNKYGCILSEKELKMKVKHYSYGQRKKLSIIIAKIIKPKYLIIDEISNGLDFETLEWLKKELINLSKDITIIGTGHQFDFYNEIVDDLFILHDNQIKKIDRNETEGDLKDVYKRYLEKF